MNNLPLYGKIEKDNSNMEGYGVNEKMEILRQLPSVDKLINSTEIRRLDGEFSRRIITDAAREVLEETRQAILKGDIIRIDDEDLLAGIFQKLKHESSDRLKEVINGTGVIIHTNLGRAPLPEKAAEKISRISSRYINLEYNLEDGERGHRNDIVRDLLCRITGAEDGMVVNNNAAAVLLVLSAMARGKEVIISRGQLVEIGGSFRVPEVMEQGGAVLVEVGTTNKTYIRDYEVAIGENTGILLKVHTSNYRICGFAHEVSGAELVELGRRHGIPVVEDLGSGILVDLRPRGLGYEPGVMDSIRAGMDIVTFSGDKLLGGPQAGIILGRKEYIEKIKKHPLARAVRIDKFTLAALESTLRLYFDEETAFREIPVLRMATMSLEELERKARALKDMLEDIHPFALVKTEKEYSRIGGGSMPVEQLETRVVSIMPHNMTVNRLDEQLRGYAPPIVGRISQDKFFIDVRTVFDDQVPVIAEAVREVIIGGEAG